MTGHDTRDGPRGGETGGSRGDLLVERAAGDDVVRAEQVTLPFGPDADDPIPFVLTARARRVVAPDSLPDLEILPESERGVPPVPPAPDDELPPGVDPGDTRPARARALRRAGFAPPRIAGELGVDELLVRAWCGEAGDGRGHRPPRPVRRARGRPADPAPDPPPAPERRPDPAADTAADRSPDPSPVATPDRGEPAAGTADDVARRLEDDPTFAAAAGLLTGVLDVTAHTVVLTFDEPATARALTAWLRREVDPGLTDRVRVVLLVGAELSADVQVDRWAAATGIDRDRFVHAPWRSSPDPGAARAVLRLTDPGVAGRLVRWRDAVLERLDRRCVSQG